MTIRLFFMLSVYRSTERRWTSLLNSAKNTRRCAAAIPDQRPPQLPRWQQPRPPNELICQSLNKPTHTYPSTQPPSHPHIQLNTTGRWEVGGGVDSKSMQLHQLSPIETQEAFGPRFALMFPVSVSVTADDELYQHFLSLSWWSETLTPRRVEGLSPSR